MQSDCKVCIVTHSWGESNWERWENKESEEEDDDDTYAFIIRVMLSPLSKILPEKPIFARVSTNQKQTI